MDTSLLLDDDEEDFLGRPEDILNKMSYEEKHSILADIKNLNHR
jgi:hypothetical protein